MSSEAALLKKALALARKFPQYNFREYFIRKTKSDLELAKSGKYAGDAQATVDQMKRMVTLNTLYGGKDAQLVIEQPRQKEQ